MTRIAVLVSGGGTNLQALIDAQARGELGGGEIALVVSSNPGAYALARAEAAGIPTECVRKRDFADPAGYDRALIGLMEAAGVELVVAAGFLSVLGDDFVRRFARRIINVHPALIPSFCGKGMYGLHVHEAALDYGVKVSGATIHFVNEVVDGGEILLQKAIEVEPGDTPETLQRRIMEQCEQPLLVRAVAMFGRGEIR